MRILINVKRMNYEYCSHRVKRSSGEFNESSDKDDSHDSLVRIARDASNSRQLRRRVRSNTAFSAWGGK